jgi:Flp pilus assembly protein TadG
MFGRDPTAVGAAVERNAKSMLRRLARYYQCCAGEVARFCSARRGATAVEFAIIAPAFVATLFAVLQTTLFLFAQQVLQNAADEVGRQFMTGQIQNAGTTESQLLTNTICPLIQALFTCNSSTVQINVQEYADFASASTAVPTTFSWDPGTPGQVMVVQLVYQWPIVGGPFGYVLSNLGNGTTEMMGVSAFRVEPY